MTVTRQLHLNAFLLADGRHDAAWQYNRSKDSFTDIDHFVKMTQIAERGTFDAMFRGDNHGMIRGEEGQRPWHALEPLTLLTAISQKTERIGLVGTHSAIFGNPYDAARQFASFDHISRGRAAWNIVTSWDPRNSSAYGTIEQLPPAERYRWANEYVEIVARLWDSLDDELVVADFASGIYLDETKVHTASFSGKYFSMSGELGIPPTPQGHPVMFHAGASPESRRLGARWADGLFTIQRSLESAQDFYASAKQAARDAGRDPEGLLVFPGLYVTVGSTEAEAKARKAELDAIHGEEYLLGRLANRLHLPVELLELDKEIPYDRLDDFPPPVTRPAAFREQLVAQARTNGLTVREVLDENPGGHTSLVGSAEQVADHLITWYEQRGADGFNLFVDTVDPGLELFVDHVVPILRERGIFRHEYPGTTFRDILGLPAPAARFPRREVSHA